MSRSLKLHSLHIIESDVNGDSLITWSFPASNQSFSDLILSRSKLMNASRKNTIDFIFGRHLHDWYYIQAMPFAKEQLSQVKQFCVILRCKDFHPEKYQEFCKFLGDIYNICGNPSLMATAFISVNVHGFWNHEQFGTFNFDKFTAVSAFYATSACMRGLILEFGLEIILICVALLLKKRIVIFDSNLRFLLDSTRTMPLLSWHRQNWDIVHPFIDLSKTNEVFNLKSLQHYVAGVTDPSIEDKEYLFDVLVNMPRREIYVASHAKENFVLSKIHKDIASQLVSLAQNDECSNQDIVQELSSTIGDLISNLKSLASDQNGMLSPDCITSRNLTASKEKFLINLAVAEGLMKM
ncbi:Protein FAM45A [Trichoplax sp. H2]|nr:Protein FAM45A [Trichoplax sp. H2]|eukprot:RDD38594.1 Protein FAM45A [Trichoplax sp. H2]